MFTPTKIPAHPERPEGARGTGIRRALVLASLGAIVVFHLVNNAVVLTKTRLPLTFDASDYFTTSLQINRSWARAASTEDRPPVPMIVSALLLRIAGEREAAAVLGMNLLALALLTFSVYGIGRILYRDELAGLVAAGVASSYPIVIAHSRVLMADLPLAAMVALFYYLQLRSDCFARRRYSILTGLAAGIGMLTKPIFPLFALPAYAISTVALLRSRERRRLIGPWVHLVGSGLLGAVIAAPWYLGHGRILWTRFVGINIPDSSETLKLDLGFLVHNLWQEQLTALFGALLLAGLVLGSRRFLQRPDRWIVLALWVLVPYLVISTFPLKHGRYALPYLPALALLTAGLVTAFAERARPLVTGVLLAGCAAHCLFVSHSPLARAYLPILRDVVYAPRPPRGQRLIKQDYIHYGLHQAEPDDWRVGEISKVIQRCATPGVTDLRFIFCPPLLTYGVSSRTIERRLRIKRLIHNVDRCLGEIPRIEEIDSMADVEGSELVVACDFPRHQVRCDREARAYSRLIEGQQLLTRLGSVRLVDGTGASVLGRNVRCTPNRVGPVPRPPDSYLIDAGGADQAHVVGGHRVTFKAGVTTRSEDLPASMLGTGRHGDFRYHLELLPGRYQVDLWFVEARFRRRGQRRFNVWINRRPRLEGFDILGSARPNRPLHKRLIVDLPGSRRLGLNAWLPIRFESLTGHALVSAIRVRRE